MPEIKKITLANIQLKFIEEKVTEEAQQTPGDYDREPTYTTTTVTKGYKLEHECQWQEKDLEQRKQTYHSLIGLLKKVEDARFEQKTQQDILARSEKQKKAISSCDSHLSKAIVSGFYTVKEFSENTIKSPPKKDYTYIFITLERLLDDSIYLSKKNNTKALTDVLKMIPEIGEEKNKELIKGLVADRLKEKFPDASNDEKLLKELCKDNKDLAEALAYFIPKPTTLTIDESCTENPETENPQSGEEKKPNPWFSFFSCCQLIKAKEKDPEEKEPNPWFYFLSCCQSIKGQDNELNFEVKGVR